MRRRRRVSKRYKKITYRRNTGGSKIARICLTLLAVCLLVIGIYFALKLMGVDLSVSNAASMPESSYTQIPSEERSEAGESSAVSSEEEPEPPPEPVSIHILGVGDNLIHDAIYKQAERRAADGTYDFSYVYANVADDIAAADISVINQETILASRVYPPSNYPLFCTPVEMGDELVRVGFDVINQANNHLLDKGIDGMEAALAYWDTQPVAAIGAYRSNEDLLNIRIVESNGIKTAHIGITEMTNGLYMPEDSPYVIVYNDEEELIERLIKQADEQADVVVVSAHWGNENTSQITENQEALAQKMVDWGADIIFGNHAHTLQPLQVLTRASDGAQCPVIYAMGNFVSAQAYGINMIGGMLDVTVTKDLVTNETTFTDMTFIPTVTHYDAQYANIRIYKLSDYTEELAASHGVRVNTPAFSMEYLQGFVDENIPAEYLD